MSARRRGCAVSVAIPRRAIYVSGRSEYTPAITTEYAPAINCMPNPKSKVSRTPKPSGESDVSGPTPAGARKGAALEKKPPAQAPAGPDQHRGEPQHPGVPLAPPGIVPESDVRVHSPAAAAPQPAHGQVEELGELPRGYGDGRLVGLVRDPNTLYVYWDFSPQQIDQAFAGLGASRALLRLWNARTVTAELVREVEVHLEARGWYVRELPGGTELRPEMWAVGERGARLLRAARPVRLPPAWPSEQLESFYLHIPFNQPLPREGLAAGRPLSYGGAAPAGWERRLQPRSFSGSSFGGPFGSSPPGRPPWSATHLVADSDKGKSEK
jgi:hypothetical protein